MYKLNIEIDDDGYITMTQVDLHDEFPDVIEVPKDKIPYLANALMGFFLGNKEKVTIE